MFYFLGSTNIGRAIIIQLQKCCLYKGKTVLPKIRLTNTLSFSVCISKLLTAILLKSFKIAFLYVAHIFQKYRFMKCDSPTNLVFFWWVFGLITWLILKMVLKVGQGLPLGLVPFEKVYSPIGAILISSSVNNLLGLLLQILDEFCFYFQISVRITD